MKKETKIAIGISVIAALIITGFVFRKQIKSVIRKTFSGYKWFDEGLTWYRNSVTKAGVNSLHPEFVDDVKDFFSWIEKNTDWEVIWTSGYRTFEKQAALHEENPNNAKAGESDHNYGFAFDLNLKNKKTGVQLKKASPKSDWEATGIIKQAKKMGLSWGGDYKNYYDPVHFAKLDAPIVSEMLAMYEAGRVDSRGYVLV